MVNTLSLPSATEAELYFKNFSFPITECSVFHLAAKLIKLIKSKNKRAYIWVAARYFKDREIDTFNIQSCVTAIYYLSKAKSSQEAYYGTLIMGYWCVKEEITTVVSPLTIQSCAVISPFFTLTPLYRKILQVADFISASDLNDNVKSVKRRTLALLCGFAEAKHEDELSYSLVSDFSATLSQKLRERFDPIIPIMNCLFDCGWERALSREPYTSLPLLSADEADRICDSSTPGDVTDLGILTVRALNELRRFGESKSSMGQYAKIFRRLRWFCHKRGITVYSENAIRNYVAMEDDLTASGKQLQWKSNIARRAVKVLKAVAGSGHIERGIFIADRDPFVPRDMALVRESLRHMLIVEKALMPSFLTMSSET